VNTLRGRNALATSIAAVAAVAAAGCGSSSNTTPITQNTTSTSPAVAQIEAAVAPAIGALKAVQADPRSAKRSSTWSALAAKLQASVIVLQGIAVTASDKSKYRKAVSLVGAMGSDATKIATAVARHNRAAANAGVQKFKQDAQKLAAL
jgi:hypothetical protein